MRAAQAQLRRRIAAHAGRARPARRLASSGGASPTARSLLQWQTAPSTATKVRPSGPEACRIWCPASGGHACPEPRAAAPCGYLRPCPAP
eukprot:scaffold4659_cov125-Isochrysis_galbana.AAC.13